MNSAAKIAKHVREAHFGENWTSVNLKENLEQVSWQQAITKVHSLNSIAALVYHINYFVSAVLKVLQGEPLNAHDQYSFDHPPIQCSEDWERLLEKTWNDAEELARLIEQLPDDLLDKTFVEEKYGSYYTNLTGIVEHTYYHSGQVVLIKKLLSHMNGL